MFDSVEHTTQEKHPCCSSLTQTHIESSSKTAVETTDSAVQVSQMRSRRLRQTYQRNVQIHAGTVQHPCPATDAQSHLPDQE
jgi:hypothetical protein